MRELYDWEMTKSLCLICIESLSYRGLWVLDSYTPANPGACQQCGDIEDLFPSIVTADFRFKYHGTVLRLFPDNYCMCGRRADFMANEMTDRFGSVTFVCGECAKIHPGSYCPIDRIKVASCKF